MGADIMATITAGLVRSLPQQRWLLREMQRDLIEWRHNGELVRGRATGELFGADADPMVVGYARFILEPSGTEVWEFPMKVLADGGRLVDSDRALPSPVEVLLQDPAIEPDAKAAILRAMASEQSTDRDDGPDSNANAPVQALDDAASAPWHLLERSWPEVGLALRRAGTNFSEVAPLPALARECVDAILNQRVSTTAVAAFASGYWSGREVFDTDSACDARNVSARELNDWIARVDVRALYRAIPQAVWDCLPDITDRSDSTQVRTAIALGLLLALGEHACAGKQPKPSDGAPASPSADADHAALHEADAAVTQQGDEFVYPVSAALTGGNGAPDGAKPDDALAASQFCGVCGALVDRETCDWCGSTALAPLNDEFFARQVLIASRRLVAGIVTDDQTRGPQTDEWWKLEIGPRVGIATPGQNSDGTYTPLCIELTTSERNSPALALVMEAHERYASLAACYPGSNPTRYSRIALRPGDTVDTLARLIASAWLVQTIESQSARRVMNNSDQPGERVPTLADLAPAFRGRPFSFSADIETAQSRWEALPHSSVRRQGEVVLMNVVRMYERQSAGVPVTCSAVLQEHPVWGEGLLVTGSHNTDWSIHDRDGVHDYVRTIAENDRIRHSTGSATDLLGSWCLDIDNRPTFVTFVPAPLCEAGILIRLMDQLLGRFDWMGRYALQEMANNQGAWLAS